MHATLQQGHTAHGVKGKHARAHFTSGGEENGRAWGQGCRRATEADGKGNAVERREAGRQRGRSSDTERPREADGRSGGERGRQRAAEAGHWAQLQADPDKETDRWTEAEMLELETESKRQGYMGRQHGERQTGRNTTARAGGGDTERQASPRACAAA